MSGEQHSPRQHQTPHVESGSARSKAKPKEEGGGVTKHNEVGTPVLGSTTEL